MSIEIEMPEQRSLNTMSHEARKGFRERSRSRRQTVRFKAEIAYQNLLRDLGLAQVDSNRAVIRKIEKDGEVMINPFEGAAKDAKTTKSKNEALAALLHLVHRLENDGLISQARRILKDRRDQVETNRKRDRKREIGARYAAKLAKIKPTRKLDITTDDSRLRSTKSK